MKLTRKLIRKFFIYDSKTGVFKNRIDRGHQEKGKIAGWKDRQGYLVIELGKKVYRLHRLAFLYVTGKLPKYLVDHRDRDKSNNRWSNLREATKSQNGVNCKLSKKNTSGIKGVSYDKNTGKWVVHMRINKKTKYFGEFCDINEAAKVRKKAVLEFYGEFANE